MTQPPQVNLGYLALKGRCPACGRGRLYATPFSVSVVPTCANCGLDLSQHEQGDGPAFAGILIIGTLAGMGAVLLDIFHTPPFWVHAAIWLPFVILGSIACLRISKAALIAVQYTHKREDFEKSEDNSPNQP